MERNDLCWCGSGKKYKKCHMPIEEKMLLHAEKGEIVPPASSLRLRRRSRRSKRALRLTQLSWTKSQSISASA